MSLQLSWFRVDCLVRFQSQSPFNLVLIEHDIYNVRHDIVNRNVLSLNKLVLNVIVCYYLRWPSSPPPVTHVEHFVIILFFKCGV